jgi:chemotaxis protein methyltransferase CheR
VTTPYPAFEPWREFPTLSQAEYGQFQRLIYAEAGIALSAAKHTFLATRLAPRVRDLGLPTFGAYYRRIVGGDVDELRRMLDAIAINETQFFREELQFDLLADACCGEWSAYAAAGARPRRLRVWSAACSTGEEAYSIAMVLHDRLGTAGWDIEIIASDLSTRALDSARAGVWSIGKLDHVPVPFVKRHFFRGEGPQAGRAKIGPAASGLIAFQRINLRDDCYPVTGAFDAIFCRNALIYFDAASRAHVMERLIRHLAPGGFLFLGHAESLIGTSYPLRPVMPAVYRLRAPAPVGAP